MPHTQQLGQQQPYSLNANLVDDSYRDRRLTGITRSPKSASYIDDMMRTTTDSRANAVALKNDATALKTICDDKLLGALTELVAQSRRVESSLVAHLAEVDRRKLYLREATSSMFAYCTEILHLSEHEAYLRITVARASRKHPALLAQLRDGRLHLSAIARLAPHLDRLDVVAREEILRRASHRSKRQVEELVAELAPRPDVPATIRKLPQRQAPISAPRPVAEVTSVNNDVAAGPSIAGPSIAGPSIAGPSIAGPSIAGPSIAGPSIAGPSIAGPSIAGPSIAGPSIAGPSIAGPTAPADETGASELGPDRVCSPHKGGNKDGRSHSTVQPLAPERYKVTFTSSGEFREKLERLQTLMPGYDLASVIEQAVEEKLARAEARRFGKTRTPRASVETSDTSASSRVIPAAVKREVVGRDRGRCTFVNDSGRRCESRSDLEFHHDRPFALGGDRSPENIRLLCRAHNAYLAELTYGEVVIRRTTRGDRATSS